MSYFLRSRVSIIHKTKLWDWFGSESFVRIDYPLSIEGLQIMQHNIINLSRSKFVSEDSRLFNSDISYEYNLLRCKFFIQSVESKSGNSPVGNKWILGLIFSFKIQSVSKVSFTFIFWRAQRQRISYLLLISSYGNLSSVYSKRESSSSS